MNFLVQILARISRFFKWDILYRVCSGLTTRDRRTLVFRLLKNDAETVTFKHGHTFWTVYAWDETTSFGLFTEGADVGGEVRLLLSWMKSQGRLCPDKPYIVEAGANIGISTIPLALQSDCTILAIEPSPENIALLKRNIRQNGLEERIICAQKAILDKKGKARLVLQDGASGGAEIQLRNAKLGLETKGHHKKSRIEVQGDTLMAILKEHEISADQVAFVWSDIQGSEPFLIKRGAPIWSSGVPLYLEIEPVLLETKFSLDGFIKLIEKYFSSFIEIQNLVKEGDGAEHKPISGIKKIVKTHYKKLSHTEVLLIPEARDQ